MRDFEIIEYNGDKFCITPVDTDVASCICQGCHFDTKGRCCITKEEREIFKDCYIPSLEKDKSYTYVFLKVEPINTIDSKNQ